MWYDKGVQWALRSCACPAPTPHGVFHDKAVMFMLFSELLADIGVNGPATVARLGGQEALLRRFLLRFPQDPAFSAMVEARNAGDCEALMRHVHTLKGLCANLGIDPLSKLAADYLTDLRAGRPPDALDARFVALCAEYRRVTDAIVQFLAENPA